MTHEIEPGVEPLQELPDAIDIETLPFEEFLLSHPEDQPVADQLTVGQPVEGAADQPAEDGEDQAADRDFVILGAMRSARVAVQLGHCYRASGSAGTGGCCGETEQEYVTRLWGVLEPKLRAAGHEPVRVLADPPRYEACAVMICCHADGSVNPTARGCSFGYNRSLPNAVASKAFGDRWRAEHNAAGYPGGNRPTNYTTNLARYYALAPATRAGAERAVVLEVGFLTNRRDSDWLVANVGRVADALVRTVVAFYGGVASGADTKPPYPEDGLRRGSTGEPVRWLQGRLNEIAGAAGHGVLDGLPLALDGDFGPKTEMVVKVFQGHRGLQPTGIVGPKTWAKL
jgi:hypothetical protein